MHFYSLAAYGSMIRDRVRMDAYAQALRAKVKPGSVVVDMGTGVGIWALLACKFGARKVYAIEPNDAIQMAREIAVTNGLADRIEFIQDMSTRITLSEKADLIVSDLRGVLPMFEQNLPSIIDARRRLLAPGGTLIPARESLWAAVVEAPQSYCRIAGAWNNNVHGLDMRPASRIATNTWLKCKEKITPEQLLAEPQCWATLDYATLESPDASGAATWTATRNGTGHGFVVWFDSCLADGVGFSNAPGAPEAIYGEAFFPWPEPVSISAGDSIRVQLQANLVARDYIWRWDSTVTDAKPRQGMKAEFKQSTFFAAVFHPGRLRKRGSHHTPSLNENGRLDRFMLSEMDGRNALEEIARRAAARFPERFSDWRQALAYLGDLSEKYSK